MDFLTSLRTTVNLWKCPDHEDCWTAHHISTLQVARDARQHPVACRCWRHPVLRWTYLNQFSS